MPTVLPETDASIQRPPESFDGLLRPSSSQTSTGEKPCRDDRSSIGRQNSDEAEQLRSRAIGVVGHSLLQLAAEAECRTAGVRDADEETEAAEPSGAVLLPEAEVSREFIRSAAGGIENRRALPRRPGKGGVTVRVGRCPESVPPAETERDWLLTNTRLRGTLSDVSLNAAAFDLEVDIPVGDCVLLRLENHASGFQTDRLGEVVRTAGQPGGLHRVVCRLTSPLLQDDVTELGCTLMPRDSSFV